MCNRVLRVMLRFIYIMSRFMFSLLDEMCSMKCVRTCSYPSSVFLCSQSDDDLEIKATSANNSLHTLYSINLLDGGCEESQRLLSSGKRFLVIIRCPLHSPLTSNGVKLHAISDGNHGQSPGLANGTKSFGEWPRCECTDGGEHDTG